MGRKELEKQITMIADLLEIIHAENLTIYNSILLLGTIEDGTRKALLHEWDKKYQAIRRDWWKEE